MSVAQTYFSESWTDCDMLCIVGPTACGKTSFAVETAKIIRGLKKPDGSPKFTDAEIISADSRQVYREMSIGTGKDLEEYGDIKYHLIDIAEAGEKYNLFRYKHDFKKVYADIVSRGAFPILCGGSGLYIEAVCKDYVLKEVQPNAALRLELEDKSLDELKEMLIKIKADKGERPHNDTDFDTKKRAIRAIEIAMAQNDVETIPATEAGLVPKRFKIIGLNPERNLRNERIDKRLSLRLQSGMIEEVRALLDKGIAPEDLIYYGLEYKFVTQYLQGLFDYDYMKEHLAIAIHQFAKRQMTWFRGMEKRGLEIEWIETTE